MSDTLGSVRQIADANGNVTLAESYEPYGKVLTSTGTASSIFGYSGEQIDTYIKLVFLRSRYYSPETARFLSKDVWQGDYTRPQSLNAWAYTEGNPVNRVDPTGKASPWPNEDQAITALKPYIVASAQRHNTPLTNMDDNSFAALMTAIIHWEGRLPGTMKPLGERLTHDLGGDVLGATIGYNATTGIGNITPETALQILQGIIPGLPGVFCYQIEGGYDYDSLMTASFWTGIGGSWMRPEEILFAELQDSKISLEYLAANLQRAADRINVLGKEASVFNLATYHHRGIQTVQEIVECRIPDASCGRNAIDYGFTMVRSMKDGFEALFGPGVFGTYLPFNQDELELLKILPNYLPTLIKN